ncbi:MAG: tRNA preQ1(34) S-adenosylmethionine ribosyltransferase-isomerase QueA, partial [Pseudomonadota bacterium]
MQLSAFDYELPPELIATRPAEPREAARLLHVDPRAHSPFCDHTVADLPGLLRPGDLIILNDTKVLPAALTGRRLRAGALGPTVRVNLNRARGDGTWEAFARPAKKLQVGDQLVFTPRRTEKNAEENSAESASNAPQTAAAQHTVMATVAARQGGVLALGFDMDDGALFDALHAVGTMPLPAYIASQRAVDAEDTRDYQTIFARRPGAVAAPTAGLHVTPELLDAILARGIKTAFVTLHVGAGTFLPVKTHDVRDHTMHAEWGEVSADTAARIHETRAAGGRIVALGTTALRVLETAAAQGTISGQTATEPEAGSEPDRSEPLAPFRGDTSIFITPGYTFRAVDALLTNFHLPKSTLFMLVAAFSGLETMHGAYAHAIARRYRFFSYGDACLL